MLLQMNKNTQDSNSTPYISYVVFITSYNNYVTLIKNTEH
jgi:hypothetical protein